MVIEFYEDRFKLGRWPKRGEQMSYNGLDGGGCWGRRRAGHLEWEMRPWSNKVLCLRWEWGVGFHRTKGMRRRRQGRNTATGVAAAAGVHLGLGLDLRALLHEALGHSLMVLLCRGEQRNAPLRAEKGCESSFWDVNGGIVRMRFA
jgi:hypothetical protein